MAFSQPLIGQEEINEVVDTLKSGWITTGPKTKKFESQFSDFIGTKNAIAVSSCTAALHLALVCNDIKDGDEVITTPLTFASTANVVVHQNAKPVFVDIQKDTYNIDPDKIEEKITDKTKAIIPVHYAGHPCDMDQINKIAKKHKIMVIEDAAHSLSAEYKGQKIGTLGNIGCFSFYPTKNMTTAEGGMMTTNNDKLADKIRMLSLHGINKDAWKRYSSEGSWYYEIFYPGYKYNMTDIQASMGIHQLKNLKNMQKIRENIAKRYNEAFQDLPNIILPTVRNYIKHSWHLYAIQVLGIKRNKFIEELKSNQVGFSIHFIPLHYHPYYKERFGFKKGDFPVTEKVYERIVSIPLYPKMSDKDIEHVISVIKKVLK